MRRVKHFRRAGPQNLDHCPPRLFVDSDPGVWLLQIQARIQSHHARGFEGFFRANFRRAPRAHFATGHIENSGAIAERFQLQQRPSHR